MIWRHMTANGELIAPGDDEEKYCWADRDGRPDEPGLRDSPDVCEVIGARRCNLMEETRSECRTEDARSDQKKNHAAENERQRMAPIHQHQPGAERNGQQNGLCFTKNADVNMSAASTMRREVRGALRTTTNAQIATA